MTAATGIRRAKLFSSRTRPWRSCCAANSKPCSPTSAQTWSPPLPPGPSPGSSTSTIGVKVTRPCCAISHDTYSASPSPTRASSLSTTTPSASATSSANHRAGAPAACTATSSCAGSSSTSCPKACIRSDILAFATVADASAPLRPAFSSSANAQPRRPPNPRHQAFSKSLTKAPQSPPHRGAVQLAVEATSSTSAGSRPKMPSDHDTLLPLPGSIVLIVRVLEAPQPSSARRPDHLSSRVQQTLDRPFVARPSSRRRGLADWIGSHLRAPLRLSARFRRWWRLLPSLSKRREAMLIQDHPTAPVTLSTGWSRSIATGGRDQSEYLVAINRCAQRICRNMGVLCIFLWVPGATETVAKFRPRRKCLQNGRVQAAKIGQSRA